MQCGIFFKLWLVTQYLYGRRTDWKSRMIVFHRAFGMRSFDEGYNYLATSDKTIFLLYRKDFWMIQFMIMIFYGGLYNVSSIQIITTVTLS